MKFVLDAEHFLWNDELVPAGTEIGDDTGYPIPDGWAPSAAMTPLDDEAKALIKETAKHKQNWGRPEEGLPLKLTGDQHPFEAPTTINRTNQPIIPPPLEHVTRPNDQRPNEAPRLDPITENALKATQERIAKTDADRAEDDKRMAVEANRMALERTQGNDPKRSFQMSGSKPPEVAPGQGPAPKTAAQSGVPGQGPGPKLMSTPAKGTDAKPPAPPSAQVPRDTQGLTPTSESGEHVDPTKEEKK